MKRVLEYLDPLDPSEIKRTDMDMDSLMESSGCGDLIYEAYYLASVKRRYFHNITYPI